MQVLSVLLCAIALIYLLARGEGFRHALGFIVVLLVASIPIAIEIVRCVPVTVLVMCSALIALLEGTIKRCLPSSNA